jgi:hypothetical protein
MRQLQNDSEKSSFYQNHRSNMPPDSVFTYGLINNSGFSDHKRMFEHLQLYSMRKCSAESRID